MSALPRPMRLKSSQRIGELFRRGYRAGDGRLTLLGLPNGLPQTRLAVAVSKRHGGAVRRNRLKRLCRAAFRTAGEEIPAGWDLVVLPSVRSDHTVAALAGSLGSAAARLVRKACKDKA